MWPFKIAWISAAMGREHRTSLPELRKELRKQRVRQSLQSGVDAQRATKAQNSKRQRAMTPSTLGL